MSDNAEKISNPGLKNVLRVYDKKTGKMKADIIILEGESIDESKDLLLKSDKAPWRFRTIPAGTYRVQQMLIPIFKQGKLVYKKPNLKDIMTYADEQIQTLWPEYLRLVNPEEMWGQTGRLFLLSFPQLLFGALAGRGAKAPFLHYCIRGNPYGFNRYAQEI